MKSVVKDKPMQGDIEMFSKEIEYLTCKITGHRCGTDTWMIGRPCLCESCQQWLIENQECSPTGISELIDEHFFEL